MTRETSTITFPLAKICTPISLWGVLSSCRALRFFACETAHYPLEEAR
jgi:hypothetical protein